MILSFYECKFICRGVGKDSKTYLSKIGGNPAFEETTEQWAPALEYGAGLCLTGITSFWWSAVASVDKIHCFYHIQILSLNQTMYNKCEEHPFQDFLCHCKETTKRKARIASVAHLIMEVLVCPAVLVIKACYKAKAKLDQVFSMLLLSWASAVLALQQNIWDKQPVSLRIYLCRSSVDFDHHLLSAWHPYTALMYVKVWTNGLGDY